MIWKGGVWVGGSGVYGALEGRKARAHFSLGIGADSKGFLVASIRGKCVFALVGTHLRGMGSVARIIFSPLHT